MELHEALHGRASIRAFTTRPVPRATLERALTAALASPSWANTQPYRLALATDGDCDALRAELLAATEREVPQGEHDLLFDYPPELQARRRATGFGLYEAMGIARHDHDGRAAQYRRNFAFFDAPAAAFLFAHEALGSYSVLDAGCFLQSFLLAAAAAGLGTCAQASLASYPQVIRRHFDVPDGYRLLCGISIGWPAEAPEHRFRPGRMTLAELLVPQRREQALGDLSAGSDHASGGVRVSSVDSCDGDLSETRTAEGSSAGPTEASRVIGASRANGLMIRSGTPGCAWGSYAIGGNSGGSAIALLTEIGPAAEPSTVRSRRRCS